MLSAGAPLQLIFKKAFGFELIPSDLMVWSFEMAEDAYKFRVGQTDVTISFGQFGLSDLERHAIDAFLPSSRRPLGHPIQTLDVALELQDDLALQMDDCASKQDVADGIVSRHIGLAFQAVRTFIERYRHCKYIRLRGNDRWIHQQTFVPRITEHEFNTYLFYMLTTSAGDRFVGSLSKGRLLIAEPLGSDFSENLHACLDRKVPTYELFIEDGWERFFHEDFAGAVLYCAIAAERALARVLRTELTDRGVANPSQIGKTIDDTSNRILCTVVLGVLGIGTSELRDSLVALFNLRNEIAHGQKPSASRQGAKGALDTAESFLILVEQWALARNQEEGND